MNLKNIKVAATSSKVLRLSTTCRIKKNKEKGTKISYVHSMLVLFSEYNFDAL